MSESLLQPPAATRRRLVLLAVAVLVLTGLTLVRAQHTEPAPVSGSYELVGTWQEANGRSLDDPFAVTVAPGSGQVLVTDARNQRVVIFSAAGEFRFEFGTAGDGPGQFERPTGVAVGPDGAIYVADYDQDRIQKFDARGQFILAWGSSGTGDDQFQSPAGLVIDEQGRVLVADFMNKVVKMFDDQGQLLEVIGRPGHEQAGELNYPTAVALAADGDIWVADAYNHRLQAFTDRSKVRLVVGPALPLTVGLQVPTGIAVEPGGTILHVADSANHRVVMLTGDGRFLAAWKLVDAGPEYGPTMVAISPDGELLYATDTAADRVIVLKVNH